MWKQYEGYVTGTKTEGDKSVTPTRWWNHLYSALVSWKVVTVFEVPEQAARSGYKIGYLAFNGEAMIEDKVNHSRRFRMKNGHEDCTFFAITRDGEEVPLKVVARTVKNDEAYADVPLH